MTASRGQDTVNLPMQKQVKRAILRGEWRPGEKLSPALLATHFETSTTVVREALTRLSGTDLVVARPNRGFFVRDLDLRELRDITELRCVTEGLAVRLSVERSDVHWESELIAAHHRLDRTPRRLVEDPGHVNDEWEEAHRDFHHAVLAACQCEPMTRLSANLADATELYRRSAAPSAAAHARDVEQEHRDILDAVIARDADRAAGLLRAHYEKTVAVVFEAGLDLETRAS